MACASPYCCEVFTLGAVDIGDGNDGGRYGVVIFLVLFLGWCFMGVALISDVFMGAIEKITSKKARKFDKERNRYTTVTVWNSTVANLTLMALGSSAPEIMLNVIGIIKDDFEVSTLGPSTIVGSAAFNLLVIIAVCVMAIPDGETRYIKEFPTYVCTAVFSLFAYLWLCIIIELDAFGKNTVSVAEGTMTFLWFPILVGLAYLLDVGYCFGKDESSHKNILAVELTKEELAELECQVRRQHGADLTEEQVAKFVQIECGQPWSRAHYRVQATRQMFKGKRVQVQNSSALGRFGTKTISSLGAFVGKKKVVPLDEEPASPKSDEFRPAGSISLEFSTPKYAVLESAGTIRLQINRKGDLTSACTVEFATRDGTAKDKTDYQAKSGTIRFDKGVETQFISLDIVNDNAFEEDEEFYVDLKTPFSETNHDIQLGEFSVATVVIIDDDNPGYIKYPKDTLEVNETLADNEVAIQVVREKGSSGLVTCKYHTEDASAVAGIDFESVDGTLEFPDGETTAVIKVQIKGKGRYEQTEMFRVILKEPITGGAKFDPDADGVADGMCVLTVFIKSGAASKQRVDNLMGTLMVKMEKAKIGHSNWGEQFKDAILINGGDDEGEGEGDGSPGHLDMLIHVISVPWKLVFALCPPTDYCGGWVCFVSSLMFIGCVTLIIGDAAELLGCFFGVDDLITAITFVALGTSLPDTFASKTAAVQDPHADASIVNVTGSNSVNVFLGIGLPWMLGAIYHWGQGSELYVASGALVSSVIIFSVCAVMCLALLYFRRVAYGGELGGPRIPKILTSVFLVALWITYVACSAYIAVSNSS